MIDVDEVLLWCLRHFKHMDEADAAVHTAVVRYSPITFRLAEALNGRADRPEVWGVMAHLGDYEEDKGR